MEQDGILQILYWMRGEGLGEDVAPEVINRLLRLDPAELGAALDRLVERGLVARGRGSVPDAVTLTDDGSTFRGRYCSRR